MIGLVSTHGMMIQTIFDCSCIGQIYPGPPYEGEGEGEEGYEHRSRQAIDRPATGPGWRIQLPPHFIQRATGICPCAPDSCLPRVGTVVLHVRRMLPDAADLGRRLESRRRTAYM